MIVKLGIIRARRGLLVIAEFRAKLIAKLERIPSIEIAQNYGRIVNIASVKGKEGNPNASA